MRTTGSLVVEAEGRPFQPTAGVEDTAERWQPRWLLMLILVYTAVAIAVMRPVTDLDVWWHLRTGEWILEHRAVPWTDPFSSYGLGKAWIAYNWLFEVLFFGSYRAIGLHGPLLYAVVMCLGIAAALHTLIMRFEHRVTRAAALAALGIGAMGPALTPRSFLITILFFLIELHVLFSVRASGRTRPLVMLPVLFALWANFHIQFIYGLFVLGLAIVDSLLHRLAWIGGSGSAVRAALWRPLVITGFVSCLATVLTPYHLYLHASILEVVGQVGIYNWNTELLAMDFRQPANWLVLALTLGAVFLLGRREGFDPLTTLLLAMGILVSFRSRRDMWVVVIAALIIIAQSSRSRAPVKSWVTWGRMSLLTLAVALVFVAVGVARDLSSSGLDAAVAREYPADAARVIEARGYKGPLFNTYDWGGYLIWRLPQLPVIMDGRANLHTDARIERALATWLGHRSWESDPELAAANLVIAPINLALTSLLRLDPRFELVHEDRVAAVFVAKKR